MRENSGWVCPVNLHQKSRVTWVKLYLQNVPTPSWGKAHVTRFFTQKWGKEKLLQCNLPQLYNETSGCCRTCGPKHDVLCPNELALQRDPTVA